MDFDSPDVAKEFPGLYMGDVGKSALEDEDDEKLKKRKEKKESKKEKGYAALAGESSPDEDEDANAGKSKKIKASFKLSSAKKKDKKSIDKPDKEKAVKKSVKEKEEERKPAEKDHKSFEKEVGGSEKEKKLSDKEKGRKSAEKEKEKDKKTTEKDKEKEKKSAEKDKEKKAEKDKKLEKEKKKEEKKKKTLIGDSSSCDAGGVVAATSSPGPVEKEKGLNLNQALNAFLNAPAPRLLKKDKDKDKDKEAKKSKDGSKVKLKLKRSKNSLDEQSSQSDIPFAVCHQFPEEPEAIAKEIKKYEAMLEQTHTQIKSSKKVSKKSEEQLWELQRTLTQLKRKLRSVNALSVGNTNVSNTVAPAKQVAVPAALLPESQKPSAASKELSNSSNSGTDHSLNYDTADGSASSRIEGQQETSQRNQKLDLDMSLDFTRQDHVVATENVSSEITVSSTSVVQESAKSCALPDSNALGVTSPAVESSLDTKHLTHFGSDSSNFASISPIPEVEKFQVEVEVHALNVSPTFQDPEEFYGDGSTTPDSRIDSPSNQHLFKALSFSEDEGEEEDADEITDISTLSLRNNYPDSETVSVREKVVERMCESQGKIGTLDRVDTVNPFEMAVFLTDEYLTFENEALIGFNQALQGDIAKEEAEIEDLMDQLEQMENDGVDIDAPEIDLDLDQFDSDELLSLWQITKLENEALNERVNQLRQLVAGSKLEEFRLETRVKYLEDLHRKAGNLVSTP